VSTTTITNANGTHRFFAVTCSQGINVSAGVTLVFIPGPESLSAALSSVFTVLSIVSAIGVTMIAIVFQGKERDKLKVLIPSLCALCAFSCAIVLTVVFGLSGPLTGAPPPGWGVNVLVVSTLWGYGLSVMALAGIITGQPNSSEITDFRIATPLVGLAGVVTAAIINEIAGAVMLVLCTIYAYIDAKKTHDAHPEFWKKHKYRSPRVYAVGTLLICFFFLPFYSFTLWSIRRHKLTAQTQKIP
jgi:hypothetical protein